MADYTDLLEQAGRQFNVDPKLLSLVMGQESGGNAGAVSPKGARGPMQVMPATAKEMGVTDPSSAAQNIMAGAKYLSQQLDKYKDPAIALAAYNAGPGAVDKHGGIPPFPETQGYVKSIMGAYQSGTQPAVQGMAGLPPVSGPTTGASAKQPNGGASAQMPGLPPVASVQGESLADDPFAALVAKSSGGQRQGNGAVPSGPQADADPFALLEKKAFAAKAQPENSLPPTVNGKPWQAPGGVLMGVGDAMKGGLETMLHAGAWVGDKVAPNAQITRDAHTAIDQLANNNQMQEAAYQTSRAKNGGTGFDGKRMVGAVAGSTPLMAAVPAVGGAGLGGIVLRGGLAGASNALMTPVEDAKGDFASQKMGQIGVDAALGGVLGPVAHAAGKMLQPVAAAVANNPLVSRLMARTGVGAADNAEQATNGVASASSIAPASTLRGVGAASANLNPYPALSGQEAARGGSSTFPQVKTAKMAGNVPVDEQRVRSQIANEILGDGNEAVRPGVITGNENTLRSEYTHAKSSENTPAQLLLRSQIAREQGALSEYAQQRVESTGANPNLVNNEQRGQVINDAFHGEDGLTDYFKRAKQQIYDQAKVESGSNPIETQHVDALLSDPQFLAEAERNGHTSVVSGAQKLIELARKTGFKDPISGEVHSPGSVGAWDAVRKSNNAGWSPDNARTIATINRAIDQDVSSAAGSDAYKLGDAIHRAEKTIMDTKAIKSVFGGMDANGIKDGVAMELLPKRLNNMPLDQWRHVYTTLDDLSRGQVRGAPSGLPEVPQALRDQAAAARNEISGSLAREVYEQGAGKSSAWNQNATNKTLNSVVGQKILETFPPDEVQRFHTLNLGGQIMPGVHSYEGAALQAQRMSKPGFIENHAGTAAVALGGSLGGVVSGGAAAGAGATAGGWVGSRIATRAASKRLQGESNRLLEAMQSNSKLGKRSATNSLTGD